MGALKRLGVAQHDLDRFPNITNTLKRSVGGHEKIIEMLRFSGDPGAQALLQVYDDCPVGDRKYISIEAYCIKASVSPALILGAVVMSAKQLMGQESALLTIMEHPEVVRKTIQYAKELPGASADRKMVHDAVGYLPTAKGGGVGVNFYLGDRNTPPPAAPTSENEPEESADFAFSAAFPSIGKNLEKWGEMRRNKLIEANR